MALGRFLDGDVSLLYGTHTHVQTADEQIFAGGTAYLTDVGMTGPSDGVIGMETAAVLERFTSAVSERFACRKRVHDNFARQLRPLTSPPDVRSTSNAFIFEA